MGRMKEIFMQMYYANDGLPEEATLADLIRMEDLKIYEWREYERAIKLKEERLKIDQNNLQVQQDQAERQSQQKEIIEQYKNK